jgi:hypothetical protein
MMDMGKEMNTFFERRERKGYAKGAKEDKENQK